MSEFSAVFCKKIKYYGKIFEKDLKNQLKQYIIYVSMYFSITRYCIKNERTGQKCLLN